MFPFRRSTLPPAALAVALIAAPVSIADVVPISASRSVGLAPYTQFGRFNDSFTDNESGGGSPPAQMSVTMTQDSTIGDGTTSPFVSYYGLAHDQAVQGAPTSVFAMGTNRFTLVFQLTTPQTLVHTFSTSGFGQFFSCTLTPSGGPATNLLLPGANRIPLSPGTYTLDISAAAQAYNGPNYESSWTLAGTLSFVPATATAAPLALVAGLAAIRRRRPSGF